MRSPRARGSSAGPGQLGVLQCPGCHRVPVPFRGDMAKAAWVWKAIKKQTSANAVTLHSPHVTPSVPAEPRGKRRVARCRGLSPAFRLTGGSAGSVGTSDLLACVVSSRFTRGIYGGFFDLIVTETSACPLVYRHCMYLVPSLQNALRIFPFWLRCLLMTVSAILFFLTFVTFLRL